MDKDGDSVGQRAAGSGGVFRRPGTGPDGLGRGRLPFLQLQGSKLQITNVIDYQYFWTLRLSPLIPTFTFTKSHPARWIERAEPIA